MAPWRCSTKSNCLMQHVASFCFTPCVLELILFGVLRAASGCILYSPLWHVRQLNFNSVTEKKSVPSAGTNAFFVSQIYLKPVGTKYEDWEKNRLMRQLLIKHVASNHNRKHTKTIISAGQTLSTDIGLIRLLLYHIVLWACPLPCSLGPKSHKETTTTYDY